RLSIRRDPVEHVGVALSTMNGQPADLVALPEPCDFPVGWYRGPGSQRYIVQLRIERMLDGNLDRLTRNFRVHAAVHTLASVFRAVLISRDPQASFIGANVIEISPHDFSGQGFISDTLHPVEDQYQPDAASQRCIDPAFHRI